MKTDAKKRQQSGKDVVAWPGQRGKGRLSPPEEPIAPVPMEMDWEVFWDGEEGWQDAPLLGIPESVFAALVVGKVKAMVSAGSVNADLTTERTARAIARAPRSSMHKQVSMPEEVQAVNFPGRTTTTSTPTSYEWDPLSLRSQTPTSSRRSPSTTHTSRHYTQTRS